MNNQITYSERYTVKLNGKTVGEIRAIYEDHNDFPSNRQPGNLLGYAYFPKGSKESGDVFNTVGQCKASLETV